MDLKTFAAIDSSGGTSPLAKYAPGQSLSGETFTRASPGTYFDVNGVLQTATNNIKRDGHYIGGVQALLMEGAATNIVLWNRDMTNAAWVKTTMTAAKDQTGIDGTASAASSLLATAINATCLQAITLASSARFQSAYVKRLVGTGAVQMTTDGGTTWTTITITASYAQYPIPSQTVVNPSVGFRLAVSGDKIAVDYVQNETGTYQSSVIATTTAAVTRAADLYKVPLSITPKATTVYAKFVNLGIFTVSTNQSLWSISNPSLAPYFEAYNGNSSTAIFTIHHNGTSSVFVNVNALALNDTVESNSQLRSDGSVLSSQTVNGGAEAFAGGGSGVPSASLAFAANWGEQFLYIGGNASQPANVAIQSLKVVSGVASLSQMRAA